MLFKSKNNKLTKKDEKEQLTADETAKAVTESDLFPVVEIPETSLSQYKKIPLAEMGLFGMAFSQFSEGARTIVQTKKTALNVKETLFVGINPKGVPGYLLENQYGTVGNIMQINDQGKQVIAGRMRFKAIGNQLPALETTTTTLPIDPTSMMIAVAVMEINQKLDKIQASVEEIIQFLQEDKQAGQRGRLNRLGEIADEFKNDCTNDALFTQRNIEVQSIQTKAMENIEFYQTRISSTLQKTKKLHSYADSQKMFDEVSKDFAEYQLACYSYAYCNFLDVMLRKDYRGTSIRMNIDKLNTLKKKYNSLFEECTNQLTSYHHGSLEKKILDGVGSATKSIGKAIGAIPYIKEGPVDEALISAGDSILEKNQKMLLQRLGSVDLFSSSKMEPFIESLHAVDVMHNETNAMVTDGDHLYVLTE